ncbi:MAG: carboxy terminal-processing peptidase [Opitutales bacterium]|nr:carboxy terminal-processing peptidase [Opitutales bacterium]
MDLKRLTLLRSPSALCALALAVLLAIPADAGRFNLDRRDRDKLKTETVHAIDVLQRYHYSQQRFSELDSENLIKNYMKDLDNTRVFFTDEDRQFLIDRFADNLKPTYLYVGDLYPAFEIFNLYYERVQERMAWVEQRLKEPFDYESDATYRPDRRKADWPADSAAADELWDRRLTFELISELLEDETEENAIRKLQRRYERMQRYVDEIERHNVMETFLTSLAKMYDPHSSFFSWDSAQEFNIQISNALVGIGAQLRDIDGVTVIESLIPGGPAEMSGQIHPGDQILEVAQGDSEPVDIVGMKLRRVVQQIRGEPGTEVRLTIVPADSSKREVITLIREKIELTANLASARLFTVPVSEDKMARIGVIELPSFYGEGELGQGSLSTTNDVRELIKLLDERGIDGIVLDFRNNGGGRLDEAVNLTGLFVPQAPVVMKRNFNQSIDTDWVRNRSVEWSGPLAVLVSRRSASASEIVAGALQAHNRAVIVGDKRTHGKGTVQAPIDLRNFMNRFAGGSNLEVGTVKVTVQQFFLPNGESTQSRGVLSDILIPSADAFLLEGEKDLENALAWDKITPVEFTPRSAQREYFSQVDSSLLSALQDRSQERMQTLEEFDFLKRHIDWFRERDELKEISLNLELRQADKSKVEEMRNAFREERRSLGEALAYSYEKVDLALTKKRDQAHQEKLRETPLPNGMPRANQFYQKVYYHLDEETDDIHEIWVEYISYERMLPHADEIAVVLTEAYQTEVTEAEVETLLNRFRNRDRTASFNPIKTFENLWGDRVESDVIEATMPAFFRKLVEIEPELLLENPRLDVPLREALRVVSDWIDLRDIALVEVPLALKESGQKSADD